jgi:putative transcriptional regulator
MTITHHADDSTLMSFASGSLPEALGAVVSTHLAMCPSCRNELVQMERLGGVMLSKLGGATLASPPPRANGRVIEVRVDEGDHVLAAIDGGGDIPKPLSRLVGSETSSIRWKRLGLGVWHLPLPLSAGAKGDLRLLKVAPGQALPEHGHGGSELSLILAGSYTDSVGRFARGDIADLDDEIEHRPVADKDAGCICLIASDEKVRFKGLLARLAQPLLGM